jgi:hypothetical protein
METKEEFEKKIENIDQSSFEFGVLSNLEDLIKLIEKKYPVSETVINIIDGELTIFLIKEKTEKELMESLNQHLLFELEINTIENIKKDILRFIEEQKTKQNIFSPIQALANIQERLSEAKIITPSKRDYSVEKINTSQQETPKAPSIDPYRELPSE